MDELHMNQTSLAEKMGCSQQYVSKVLKGKENLSLESIWKIESVLNIDLVKTALSFVSGYDVPEPEIRMVAEREGHIYSSKQKEKSDK